MAKVIESPGRTPVAGASSYPEAVSPTARSRYTRRTNAIVANLRAARRQPCMRCGQPIDYDAPPEDPSSFNAGHIKSWTHHPELREDPANFQPEHAGCNKRAGALDGMVTTGVGLASRSWAGTAEAGAVARTTRTVVVTGPPAAGKTTYVEAHARPGDIRIDLDALATALGTAPSTTSDYPDHVVAVAVAARAAAIRRAETLHADVTVWIVHAVPTPDQLAAYARAGHELVTVDPGRDVVLARCARLRHPAAAAVAERWYASRSHAAL